MCLGHGYLLHTSSEVSWLPWAEKVGGCQEGPVIPSERSEEVQLEVFMSVHHTTSSSLGVWRGTLVRMRKHRAQPEEAADQEHLHG